MEITGKIICTYELKNEKKHEVWDISVGREYIIRALTKMGAKNISFIQDKYSERH